MQFPSKHVVGNPTQQISLITFRLRKLQLPVRLINTLDDIEENLHGLREMVLRDDNSFEEFIRNCKEDVETLNGVLNSVIAGELLATFDPLL